MVDLHQRFERVEKILREHASEDLIGEGVDETAIHLCEEKLGAKLPESYKLFLLRFGYIEWIDDLSGLVSGCPPGEADDIVNRVTEIRQHMYPNPPSFLIPFHGDGFGNEYCLDTREMNDGEYPVVFWNHEQGEDQTPKRVYDTFMDWLEDEVNDQLRLDLENS